MGLQRTGGDAAGVPEVGGAEELGLGDGLDEEGEELLQRHLRQALGAVWVGFGGWTMSGQTDRQTDMRRPSTALRFFRFGSFVPEARDEEHDGQEVVHQVLGAEGAKLEHRRVLHVLVVAERRGREPPRGAHHEGQRLSCRGHDRILA